MSSCCIACAKPMKEYAYSLPCGHKYHYWCIDRSVEKVLHCFICHKYFFCEDTVTYLEKNSKEQTGELLGEIVKVDNEVTELKNQLDHVKLEQEELKSKLQNHLEEHSSTEEKYSLVSIANDQMRAMLNSRERTLSELQQKYDTLLREHQACALLKCETDNNKNNAAYVNLDSAYHSELSEKVRIEVERDKWKLKFEQLSKEKDSCIDQLELSREHYEGLLHKKESECNSWKINFDKISEMMQRPSKD